jgi:hypothetical protein
VNQRHLARLLITTRSWPRWSLWCWWWCGWIHSNSWSMLPNIFRLTQSLSKRGQTPQLPLGLNTDMQLQLLLRPTLPLLWVFETSSLFFPVSLLSLIDVLCEPLSFELDTERLRTDNFIGSYAPMLEVLPKGWPFDLGKERLSHCAFHLPSSHDSYWGRHT